MSNLERRASRSQLQKRAYRYGLATAGFGLATVVVFVLALFTSVSMGTAFLLALLTAGAGFMYKRTVS